MAADGWVDTLSLAVLVRSYRSQYLGSPGYKYPVSSNLGLDNNFELVGLQSLEVNRRADQLMEIEKIL